MSKAKENPSRGVADAIRAIAAARRHPVFGGAGEFFIPTDVVKCKRCGGPLRAVNPQRDLVLLVCDTCSIGAEAPDGVIQFIADQCEQLEHPSH